MTAPPNARTARRYRHRPNRRYVDKSPSGTGKLRKSKGSPVVEATGSGVDVDTLSSAAWVSARRTSSKRPWAPWIVFHVPHASTVVPAKARSAIVLSDEALGAEITRLTDHAVDVLFVPPDAEPNTVSCSVNRFVVDVERFLDDEREPMARVGMGAIYTRTADGNALRRSLSEAERQHLLDSYYHPHHRRLTAAVDRALEAHDQALVLDLHSFPAAPLPCDQDQRPNRPDICLGTDALHTPPELVNALVAQFEGAGFSVDVDRPYSGSIVPMKHYGADLRVSSVMIEVNRRLYLQPTCAVLAENAREVGKAVQNCLSSALIAWMSLARNASTAQWPRGAAPHESL